MGFKVGDRVRIKPWSDFAYSRYEQPLPDWVIYLDKETVITKVCDGLFDTYYRVMIDNSEHRWSEDCFIDLKVEMFMNFLERMM